MASLEHLRSVHQQLLAQLADMQSQEFKIQGAIQMCKQLIAEDEAHPAGPPGPTGPREMVDGGATA